MNIKGGARGKPLDLSKHLQKDENEVVRIVRSQGVLAQDIEGAIVEMDAMGAALRTSRTLCHLQINPEPGYDFAMTEKQWGYSEDALLKAYKLENQPFIVVEHEKIGKNGVLRKHRHLVGARADLEHNRAIRCDHNYRKNEEVSRHLEREFGHPRVQGAHVEREGVARPARTPTHAEMQQADRGAVSAREAKARGAAIWNYADSGKAISAALEAHGWMLAKGDKERKDGGVYFMAVDPSGAAHELRRMVPVKAAELYARMADIDPAPLPRVKEAAEQVRAAAQELKERERDGAVAGVPRPSNMRESGPENGRDGLSVPVGDQPGNSASKRQTTASTMRGAWEQAKDAGDLIARLAAQKITLAVVSADDASKSREQAALYREQQKQLKQAKAQAELATSPAPKPSLRYAPVLKEGELVAVDQRGRVYQFTKRTVGAERKAIKERLAGVDAGFLSSVEATKAAIKATSRAAWAKEQQAKRDKARPASWIEKKISDIERQARLVGITAERKGETVHLRGNEAFAEGLDQAGITLCRVTAFDQTILDRLRQDEDRARKEAGPARKPLVFAHVKEGELAAVTRRGDVYRLNPQKIDHAGLEARLVDARSASSTSIISRVKRSSSPALPSMAQAVAAFAVEREQTEALWAQRRADNQARRNLRNESRDVARQQRVAVNTIKRGVRQTIGEGKAVARASVGIVGKVARLAKSLSPLGLISGLGDIMASPSKPTELERTVAPKVAKQRREQVADLEAYFENKDRHAEILRGISRDDAERMRQRRERGDNDPVDRGRERER
jgi:hypothetical protein